MSHLRSHVVRAAHDLREALAGREVGGQAKVGQLDGGIVCGRGQEEVLGLDVPVHDAHLVQVVGHHHHGPEVVCTQLLEVDMCTHAQAPPALQALWSALGETRYTKV